MEFIKKNKGIAVAIVIFIIAMVIYKLFSANSDIVEQGASAQNIGEDILQLNSTIDRVNLDPALFSSPSYKNLVDFSVPIAPQTVGRSNPFEVLGK